MGYWNGYKSLLMDWWEKQCVKNKTQPTTVAGVEYSLYRGKGEVQARRSHALQVRVKEEQKYDLN